MIVIHIESGLGNQMLSYCEYLAMKYANPKEKCFIETIIYEIPECNEIIRQWNGYEIDKIFGLNTPNVRELFSDSEWNQIISEIRETRFWNHNWNYPVYFTNVFRKHGLDLMNTLGDFEAAGEHNRVTIVPKYKLTPVWAFLKYFQSKIKSRNVLNFDNTDKLFVKSDKSLFSGQQLLFFYKNSGIERIDDIIRKTFVFPDIEVCDKKNYETLQRIRCFNSISMHIRRGDALYASYNYYVNGYFKRALKYLRQQVENPVFFVFCDPDTIDWARKNDRRLGLDFAKDHINFVDWNKGDCSWRDMQLMSECKHNVIVNSSFGWWGAWLNSNPCKITCSPDLQINTTCHF